MFTIGGTTGVILGNTLLLSNAAVSLGAYSLKDAGSLVVGFIRSLYFRLSLENILFF